MAFFSPFMYQELILTVKNTAEAEMIMAEMIELGFEGFEEEDGSLRAYIEAARFDGPALSKLAAKYKVFYRSQKLEQVNWNQLWESQYDPVRVDQFAAIRAGFHDPIPGVRYELLITPKMSFGTGHHAATHLMIKGMENLDLKNKSVLDMGTGTGVLAILAEKMGARKIRAIDTDHWSIENARENIDANDCRLIELTQADNLVTNELYDVILANINLGVILSLLPTFQKHLESSGLLIISGFLAEDEGAISSAAAESGMILMTKNLRNNWLRMTFKKKEKAHSPGQFPRNQGNA
jgi:ribosomal protein L11 methyltransferase